MAVRNFFCTAVHFYYFCTRNIYSIHKVTQDEMDGITHHMIDILEPDESFSAFEFKKRAEACIEDITNRGKLPDLFFQ